ncbi:MAG TPA: Uma2 family endonuclease [Gemmatimonadaceae bacterium]
MAMPATYPDWTVDMLDALPDDGQRYEIIDGELFVTPAPIDLHQYVVGELLVRLHAYFRRSGVGHPVTSPSDVRREDRRRNRVQPDVFVVRVRDGKRPAYPFDLADLLLVVEVESESNSRYDFQTKRRLYLEAGIPEYWIISPAARTVARWTRADDPGEILTERLEWQPAGMTTPFVVDLPEFFTEALGFEAPAD